MTYLVFESLEPAQSAQTQIDANMRAAIAAFNPNAIDSEGLIGRNAATGALDPDATRTTTWCEPIECLEGWALIKPEGLNARVFGGVDLLAGVENYAEAEFITLPKTEVGILKP